MRNFRRLVLGLVLVTLGTPVKAETVMYCSTELSTGLIKKDGRWREVSFNPNRYTIKIDDNYASVSGLSPGETLTCTKPQIGTKNMLTCISELNSGYIFGLNLKTGRFFYSTASIHGYISGLAAPDTDSLEAGTCTKF